MISLTTAFMTRSEIILPSRQPAIDKLPRSITLLRKRANSIIKRFISILLPLIDDLTKGIPSIYEYG